MNKKKTTDNVIKFVRTPHCRTVEGGRTVPVIFDENTQYNREKTRAGVRVYKAYIAARLVAVLVRDARAIV